MASSLSPTNVQSNLPAETLLVPSQATLSVSSPLAREMTKEKVAEGHDEEKSDGDWFLPSGMAISGWRRACMASSSRVLHVRIDVHVCFINSSFLCQL